MYLSSTPAELHDLNMNTYMHFQFQHIICHQIPAELHDLNMNTHMHSLTQCIQANPIAMVGPLPGFVLSILFIFFVRCSEKWPHFVPVSLSS